MKNNSYCMETTASLQDPIFLSSTIQKPLWELSTLRRACTVQVREHLHHIPRPWLCQGGGTGPGCRLVTPRKLKRTSDSKGHCNIRTTEKETAWNPRIAVVLIRLVTNNATQMKSSTIERWKTARKKKMLSNFDMQCNMPILRITTCLQAPN